MHILFRCDAGYVRGSGHLIRCLTLADTLAKQGCAITFLCRADAGSLLDLFKDRSYTLYTLPAPLAPLLKTEEIWDDAAQRADFDLCRHAIDGQVYDWVIVDHYALGEEWETPARSFGKKILVIDDLANRPHDCDVLLDQNEYADKDDRYGNLLPGSCKTWLGGRYALLRPEFQQARQSLAPPSRDVRNILILMGGSDYQGLSLRLVHLLKPLVTVTGIGVDIILGQHNQDRTKIEDAVADSPLFSVHINHRQVSALMRGADIAFGAGGTATWEFCCLGVPLLMITFADNQIKMAQDAERAGFARYIGHFDQIDDKAIAAAFDSLTRDYAARALMHEKSCALVDGKGADRVAGLITKQSLSFVIRKAGPEDCRDLFDWRNDALTREMSVQSDLIPFETHSAWFEQSLARPDRLLLIAESEGDKIGVIRFDLEQENAATISINLNPAWRGRGFGKILLQQAEQNLPSSVRTILADIKMINQPSIKAFEEAGYRVGSENPGIKQYLKIIS